MKATHHNAGARIDHLDLWRTIFLCPPSLYAVQVDVQHDCPGTVGWLTSLVPVLKVRSPTIPGGALSRRANKLHRLLCTCLTRDVVKAIACELGEGIWLKMAVGRDLASCAPGEAYDTPMTRAHGKSAGHHSQVALQHIQPIRETVLGPPRPRKWSTPPCQRMTLMTRRSHCGL